MRTVALSIRFFAWKFNEQGNEKLPRHGSRHSGDTGTPHGPSDPSCLILVMVRAFALCFLSGPSNDVVFRYRWEKHEHAHRNTRPTAQRPAPTTNHPFGSCFIMEKSRDRRPLRRFSFSVRRDGSAAAFCSSGPE